jgi:hypothetical protein
MARPRKPPSQTWRTFLANHVPNIAACDFLTVPTATFRVLYVFIVLRHHQRRVVHFSVTDHPYAEWAAQQIIDAFPYEEGPRFLLRDRDFRRTEPIVHMRWTCGLRAVSNPRNTAKVTSPTIASSVGRGRTVLLLKPGIDTAPSGNKTELRQAAAVGSRWPRQRAP